MEVATIIMSVVGPLVGVMFAWTLTKRDTKTEAAYALFGKLHTDMQNYLHYSVKLIADRMNRKNQPTIPVSEEFDLHLEFKLKESDLNSHRLMMGYMFDQKSSKVNSEIQTLMLCANRLIKNPLPTANESYDKIADQVILVSKAIKSVHATLPRDDTK